MSWAAICDALCWVWFVGLVACVIRSIEDAASAQTPHGHTFILPPGFLLSLVWPLALVWWIAGAARRG